jgi:hypothetical protein
MFSYVKILDLSYKSYVLGTSLLISVGTDRLLPRVVSYLVHVILMSKKIIKNQTKNL